MAAARRAGQLPAGLGMAWPKLEILVLEGAGLVSTLPPEWGQDGAFPKCARRRDALQDACPPGLVLSAGDWVGVPAAWSR